MTSSAPELKELQDAFNLIADHMYCSGAVPLDSNSSSLFYREEGRTTSAIDFLDTNDVELANLGRACQPASFGLGDKDVLDDSYRKAGKMDVSNFSAQFSIYTSGILTTVVSSLLRGQYQSSDVKAELYKLNVYGPGSFFKAHVDTPRSDAMFGSLVVVLPTKHEGGALQFRKGDQQWSFESAQLVATDPVVAFAAFFSDVEHEVLPVSSGYRVTLTYNLSWDDKQEESLNASGIADHPFMAQAKALLAVSLDDPNHLPDGGLMCFGLAHKYPIDPKTTNLSKLRLKGADATIERICKDLSLNPSLRALYRIRIGPGFMSDRPVVELLVLMDDFADLEGTLEIEDYGGGYVDYLHKWQDGVKVLKYAPDPNDIENRFSKRETTRSAVVEWVKPLTKINKFKSTFIAHGNEAKAASAYGEICLVVQVAPAAKRLLRLSQGVDA